MRLEVTTRDKPTLGNFHEDVSVDGKLSKSLREVHLSGVQVEHR